MKILLLSAIMVTMSYTCISQTLKPRILKEGNDTLFVFTISQAKTIAGIISSEKYCDSISYQQAKTILQQDTLNIFYKKQLSILQNIITNDNSMLKNNGVEMALLKSDLETEKSKTKKFKRQRWLFLVGGLLGGFVVGHL